MKTHRRVVGALLALVLPAATALTLLPGVTAAAVAATPAAPACAWNDPSTNCVHAPTPDITALPTPAFTTAYNGKTHSVSITFPAAIVAPYHTCPDGGVPINYLPCSFRGLHVSARIYVPGGNAAALVTGAVPPQGVTCDFSCTVTAAFDTDVHGPATVILSFGIGELLQGGSNDLASSVWETSISLPATPTAGTVHVVAPKVLYSGKLKTMTVQVAGKGGVPTSGVGGVFVRLVTNGQASISNGDSFNQVGVIEVVAGTKFHVVKEEGGSSATYTLMGWWSKVPSTSGSLFHRLPVAKKLKVAPSIALASAGVPKDANGVVMAVVLPKGSARIGGVVDTVKDYGQYVMVPLKAGAKLSVKAPKGTKLWVYGYTEPIHPVDTGSWIYPWADMSPTSIDQVFGLLRQDYIN